MSGRRGNPVVEFVRWAWGQLTSMRTALALLFLLALATIPGSMIPQSTVSPISVLDFQREYPTLNKILEPLGMYHVYTSPAFSAVYLLLFISLYLFSYWLISRYKVRPFFPTDWGYCKHFQNYEMFRNWFRIPGANGLGLAVCRGGGLHRV